MAAILEAEPALIDRYRTTVPETVRRAPSSASATRSITPSVPMARWCSAGWRPPEVSPQALYQWLKRLAAGRRPSPARTVGGFVPVRVVSRPTEAIGCTVVIEPGLRLECAALPGVDWLAALSAALRERVR